jgi:hypothetical protein
MIAITLTNQFKSMESIFFVSTEAQLTKKHHVQVLYQWVFLLWNYQHQSQKTMHCALINGIVL